MKKQIVALLAGAMLMLGVAGVAGATTYFSDNFESDTTGTTKTDFINWTVTSGSVDLVGTGTSWNWFPSYGKYVDMDGSTNQAGTLTSKVIHLAPGHYTLSFDLAGNQRDNNTDKVIAQVNTGVTYNTYTLNPLTPFVTFTDEFTLSSARDITLSFAGVGGDNVGLLLDNVNLSAVPEPGTMMLLGLGMFGLAIYGKRRMNKEA